MRTIIVACALILLAGPALAENCQRFVHETDPEDWIIQTEYGFDWHKHDDVFKYDVGRYTSEGDPRLTASTHERLDAEMGDSDFVQYRFAEINDKDAILWDGWFYFRGCAAVAGR